MADNQKPEAMETPVDLPDRTKAPANTQKPRKEKAPKAPKPPKGPTPPKAKKPAAIAFSEDPDSMFKTGFLADVYNERPIGSEHVKKVVTRFPPEPNGHLHIGHSKAIAINFGFARFHGGDCYLRFDDTNPKSEEEEYFIAIEDIVRWLGFSPVKVTYSSDNFDRLYELAEDLIRRDGAYVCHCNQAEIQAQRGGGEGKGNPRFACAHRTRPIEESLTEFRAMRDGKYRAGEAALRMKQDIENGNPQMWDLFAYRVIDEKDRHHFRTGNKWIIYPTYDFTHCLCDSFEGVTHSLCTTEFELSRVSYEWLCDKLEVYKPMQREYGRLNVTGTILSKRDIVKLIDGGHVGGYDDPRLYTLVGLRRRGVPPGAILSFVNELGVTKAKTNIQVHRFEQSVRRYLETAVPRLMVVMEPLKVVIDDLPEDHVEMVELPYSKDPAFGVHKVPFTRTVFIERSDFREVDSADYFRLAPGKTVGLMKVPYPITATSFEKDPETGLVTCVHAKYEKPEQGSAPKKPKTFIHWVALSAEHASPIKAEVRVINRLFNSDDPKSHPDGFLADINPNSMEIYSGAMVDIGFPEIKSRAPWPAKEGETLSTGEGADSNEYDISGAGKAGANGSIVHPETVRFQGMRVAYFALDSDSTEDKVVLNRIVALKDDAGK
ncbi:glutamine-tRNA ligase [Emergomyces africanus]|uniref:glutamine--tRNA ligase n=1 Tax=Emergomyces africanus TaxID=1955775 RepID=A0A1B7NUA0_9EURO|nr:glutamine-tRNA ligase [Emergomyces africanus]